MKNINSGNVFPFCYQAFDQSDDLFVQARVYDVSSGTPVLLGSVVMELAGQGLYQGSYLAVAHKSYLVIALCYTDDTYLTVDEGRSPWAECYRCLDAPEGLLLLNYGAFDQDATLDVAAKVYNITSGTPVLEDTIAMPYVVGGVYFGHFSGVGGDAYVVNTSCYTDDTFATLDSERPSGSEALEGLIPGVINNFTSALELTGQSLYGVLEGQC